MLRKDKIKASQFDKKLKSFAENEELRKQAIEKLKQEVEKIRASECTFHPNLGKKRRDNSMDNKINDNMDTINRLYKVKRMNESNVPELIRLRKQEEENKLKAECTFKPKIRHVSKEELNRSFSYVPKEKGFDKFVTRQRMGILERRRKKFMMESRPTGENYEKIKNHYCTVLFI